MGRVKVEPVREAPIAPVLPLAGFIPNFSCGIHLCKVKSSAGLGAFPGASNELNEPLEDEDEDEDDSHS